MIIYKNTHKEAVIAAEEMKKLESDYKDDVQISETCSESFGIFKEVDKGKYVIYNETE